MPDPRLVSRAQRAATMLERAWKRWRSAHGLAAEPLPPVSSYVGYSIEEPWGRPRVVFGVAAEDAERLAAFLQDSLDTADRAGRNGASGRPGVSDGAAGPDGAPAPGPGGGHRGDRLALVGGPDARAAPAASQPREDRPQRTGGSADGEPKPGPETGPAPPGPAQADAAPTRPGTGRLGGRPGDGAVDRPQHGPTSAAADGPADLAGGRPR